MYDDHSGCAAPCSSRVVVRSRSVRMAWGVVVKMPPVRMVSYARTIDDSALTGDEDLLNAGALARSGR